MNFAGFPPLVIALGTIALAGMLYLLQRLRTRRRAASLPTAMLWQAATRETPARVLGGRFRHPGAYLLALTIALLLWIAAANPVIAPGASRGVQVFYLDASALLTGSGEMARAKRALLADVRATAADRREVRLGDATGSTLLAAGESVSLLARRLDAISAAARPSVLAGWIEGAAARLPRGSTIRYYGGWPAARPVAARLPVGVRMVYGYLARPVAGNRGIVALGARPAASGRWSGTDVLVTLAAAAGPPPNVDALHFTLDGRAIAPAAVPLSGGRVLLRDIDANGGVLSATLDDGDSFAADDHAALRLPDHRTIAVALVGSLPRSIRAAIAANAAFVLTDPARAEVIVRADAAPVRVPTLDLTAVAADTSAFAVSGPGGADLQAAADGLDRLGLDQVDAVALADQFNRPIGVALSAAPRRRVAAWGALFADGSPFIKSAAMPLFVSRSLRWLAGRDDGLSYAKAGDTIADPSPSGLGETYLADAGELRSGGRTIAVSLTDASVTRAAADASPRPSVTSAGGWGPPDRLFSALMLVAGLLLAGEWHLFQRRRIP